MTVRVGVVGVGSIARMGHLPHYRDHPDVELVAVADSDIGRAQQAAEEFGATGVYGDAASMFKSEKLDAVSICTPNASHIELATEAVERGLHVWVEKPLGVDPAAAARLVGAVERSGCIAGVGMTHRFRNEAQVLRKFIAAGDVGTPYYARTRILRRRGTPTGWFTSKAHSGGGPLMDIGVHALDLAWWAVGMPQARAVSGQVVTAIGRFQTEMVSRWSSADDFNQNNEVFDTEDFASAYIRFDTGLVMLLEVSWALNGPEDDALMLDVFGPKGGVSLHPLCFYGEQNRIVGANKLSVQRNDPYKDEIAHFVQCVVTGQQTDVPLAQGLQVLRMLTAISESAKRGAEVSVAGQ
jgi:predicted dehydrogenase